MGRGDDEHRLIARYAARLAQHNTMVIVLLKSVILMVQKFNVDFSL